MSVGLFQQTAEKSSIAPGHHAVFLALARLQREKRALGKELSEAALKEGLFERGYPRFQMIFYLSG